MTLGGYVAHFSLDQGLQDMPVPPAASHRSLHQGSHARQRIQCTSLTGSELMGGPNFLAGTSNYRGKNIGAYFKVTKLSLQLDQIDYLMRSHDGQSLILNDSQELVTCLPGNRFQHAMQEQDHGLGNDTSEHQHRIDLWGD